MRRVNAALSMCIGLAAGCSSISIEPSTSISGTAVTSRTTGTIPADATFDVSLEARARPDSKPERIARIRQSPAGPPPYPFTFEVDPDDVREQYSYFIRAHVGLSGEILLTARPHRVAIPGRAGAAPIRLVLREPAPEAPLVEAFWVLTHLGARPMIDADFGREAQLVTHPRRNRVIVVGWCNNMIGTIQVRGQRMRFLPMPGALVACDQQGSPDVALGEALGQSVSWRLSDTNRILELFDAQGSCTLRFARGGSD